MGERALGFEVVEEESQQPLKPLILGLEVISGIWVGLWASSDLGMCEHWAWMFGECFLGSFSLFSEGQRGTGAIRNAKSLNSYGKGYRG